jgi:hypothetical protein
MAYLSVYVVFMEVRGGLCFENFERDIVDTICHASRFTGTTRPNKPLFLLHEGKV